MLGLDLVKLTFGEALHFDTVIILVLVQLVVHLLGLSGLE